MSPILSTRGLTVQFASRRGLVTAVDSLDLDLAAGGTLALVGESGCGKSATALALLGLHAAPPDARVTGSVILDGTELVGLDARSWRGVRGRRIAMVFQEPMTALNPVFSIGDQIVEALLAHEPLGRTEARRRAKALLDEVAIPDAGRRLDDYPHQLSGGQRQRALIAIAIAARPAVLIADEPTTALDVTIQAQILELLKRLKDERGMALILITHDLGVVADMADRVAVLYAGRKVEEADSRQLFRAPAHPYTKSLLATRARPGRVAGRRARLPEIAGTVPPLNELPEGCAFAPRCPDRIAECQRAQPPLVAAGPAHTAACICIVETASSAAP
jgi:peptide/nickel transport system ATP-binding protein